MPRPEGTRLLRRAIIAAGVLAAIAIAYPLLLSPRSSLLYGYAPQRARILGELAADDTGRRRAAAWAVAESRDPILHERVAGLALDDPATQVREACVYTLGRVGDAAAAGALEQVLLLEPEGMVRAAAWLSLARAAPERFDQIAALRDTPADEWDRCGIAQGRVWIGDRRGLATLFELLRAAPEWRRLDTQRFLSRSLRPALDAAGLWPIELAGDEPWPPAALALIEQRAASAGVGQYLREHSQRVQQGDALRSLLGRIEGARARLVALLFG